MKIDYNVPFYSNTEDNIHCVQASMKMAFEFFLPSERYSFNEWDKISAHVPGLWTWMSAGLMWFKRKGFDVIDIEPFDYERFSVEGGDYLISLFGEEVGTSQIQHSNIEQEIKIAKDFVREIKIDMRIPDLSDIRNLLNDGYLVMCNVNAAVLDNNTGYAGHVVVVKGHTENSLIFHDPGLPPSQNVAILDIDFYRAWAYPDKTACNISAVKLP